MFQKAVQTELSFTRPRTESSCNESWLARLRTCIVWLCVIGLPLGSIPGGDGASSGVRNWWPSCSSFNGTMSVKPESDVRFGIEDGGVGCPRVRLAQGPLREVFPGKGSSSLVMLGSLCRRGVAAACKTNLVLWMHWSWSHCRMEGCQNHIRQTKQRKKRENMDKKIWKRMGCEEKKRKPLVSFHG